MRRMILLFFLLVAGSLYAENFYVTSAAEIAANMKSAQPGEFQTLKYQDTYMSNTNYVTEKFQNFSVG